jgi:hypothetical protein
MENGFLMSVYCLKGCADVTTCSGVKGIRLMSFCVI